jgi:hypothetical protein
VNLFNKFVLLMLFLCTPVWAANPAEVEYTLGQVLEQEGALYLDYSIGENGKVIVVFGANEPDWRIKNTVKALQSHPYIPPGLMWTKTNIEFCTIR